MRLCLFLLAVIPMRRPFVLIAAIALFTTLILLLTTVSTIGQLYGALATISPLLAQLVVMLVVLLLIGALAIIIYYAALFLRPKRKRTIALPQNPDEVAEVSLQATEQQIEQIEDEIARQALVERSHTLCNRISGRRFEIVVFGLGSAGKTALVNALLGEMASPVAAPIGTTQTAQTYWIDMSGMQSSEHRVGIIDTPGLLEASALGEDRAQEAKALAAQADLLLFVIDNDLHRVEYEPLAMLAGMGKRSLLVFNKSDRYLPEEKEQILQRLKARTSGLVAAEDVVAIAADPAAIQLDDGRWVKPEPDIAAVVERIVKTLQSEGANLIAQNLLSQTQQISQEAKALLSDQRQQKADAIIERYQWISAGILAATPLPVVDMLAAAAVNARMVVELGQAYGVTVSIEEGKALAVSLTKTLTALSLAKGTMKLLAIGLQTNIATAVASKLLQGASAAYLTRIAGKSFITYFEANQDWGDGGIQAEVERQYQLNQRDEVIKQFLRSAVDKLT